MSRRRQAGSIDRILAKLELEVEKGDYYGALQMYTSAYNRLIGSRQYDDALHLLTTGTLLFNSHSQEGGQGGSKLSDMLGDHLVLHHTTPTNLLIDTLIEIIKGFDRESEGRQRFIAKVFKWSKMYTEHGDPKLHHACAEMYLSETDYATCCTHCQYLDLTGVEFYSQTLIEVSSRAVSSEFGLIITWAVLQFLTIKRTEHARRVFKLYTSQHPSTTASQFPFKEPLLNFIQFLLSAIDRRRPDLVYMLQDKYSKTLQRDPSFAKSVEKILWVYFQEKSSNEVNLGGLGGLMQSLLSGPSEPIPGPSTKTVSENNDLD